jgi:phage gpG-like protein
MSGLFSLGSFGSHLLAMAAAGAEYEHRGLEKAAKIIETEAKRVIGTYDYGWAPLAASTVAQKANGDTPLLETGAMRESIEHTVHGRKAEVGSNSDIAVYQELGTARIPARSFLAGAAVHKGKEAAHAVAGEVFLSLSSRA